MLIHSTACSYSIRKKVTAVKKRPYVQYGMYILYMYIVNSQLIASTPHPGKTDFTVDDVLLSPPIEIDLSSI
jgi:hypothetical protein